MIAPCEHNDDVAHCVECEQAQTPEWVEAMVNRLQEWLDTAANSKTGLSLFPAGGRAAGTALRLMRTR